MKRKFIFVLEQSLGHAAHSRNLERVIAEASDVEATIIRIAGAENAWNWSLSSSWRARQALTERLRRGRADAVFIHTQVASLLARSVMRSIPTVISLDATPINFDDYAAAYGHRRHHQTIEIAKRWVNRSAFSRAKAFVTWSTWAARSLVEDYRQDESRIQVIPPGVDLRLFRPGHRDGTGPVRLLFVGGNFARKGGYELLQAMDLLPGDIELDIVSDSAPALTRHGVRVHQDMKPQSDALLELYRRADVFVLPTRGDCTPQVLAEAMATSLPIVSTAVGAVPEMVRDGHSGYLVPVNDPRQLAAAIGRLAADETLRRRMGECGMEIARREHDAVRNNRAIVALLAKVADATAAA